MLEFNSYSNFQNNKYKKLYSRLILSVKNRPIDSNTIYEKHHILPKSMGGSNDGDNLIHLTLREHFLSHQLLTKFTLKKDKKLMVLAFHTFFVFHKRRKATYNTSSRQYVAHKKNLIELSKNRSNPSKKVFIFKNMKTNEIFQGTRQEFIKMSGFNSQELYNLTSRTIRWAKQWGIFYEDKGLFSYEIPIKYTPLTPIKCEHCHKVCSPGNYSRWHGKNCKTIDPSQNQPIPSKRSIIHTFKNIENNTIFKGTNAEFKKNSTLKNSDISGLTTRRLKCAKNWGVWYEDEQIFSFDARVPPFSHPLVKCEICHKMLRDCNYVRWHGPKCKNNFI